MTLKEIQVKYLNGNDITFDIVNHKRIPNAVLSNQKVIGTTSIATINSFKNWKSKLKK